MEKNTKSSRSKVASGIKQTLLICLGGILFLVSIALTIALFVGIFGGAVALQWKLIKWFLSWHFILKLLIGPPVLIISLIMLIITIKSMSR